MASKEVTLKDGRKVVVKELSALEDVMSYRMVGPDFDQDNKFGGGVTVRSIQVAMSVASVDGKELKTFMKIEEVFEFMTKFSKKEWALITDAYFDMNEADDEGE